MNLYSKQNKTLSVLLLISAFQFILAGCSKYAPVPEPPKRKVLRISLTVREDVNADFFYYIAMEIPPDNDGEGPRAILSGERRGEDWTYYLRLYNFNFSEMYIFEPADLDAAPDPFYLSPRRYSSYVYGKNIRVDFYLDKLLYTPSEEIWINFITSRLPLTSGAVNVEVIDALKSPGLSIRTSNAGQLITNDQYPNIDTPVVTEEENFPADIVSWWLRIDEI